MTASSYGGDLSWIRMACGRRTYMRTVPLLAARHHVASSHYLVYSLNLVISDFTKYLPVRINSIHFWMR